VDTPQDALDDDVRAGGFGMRIRSIKPEYWRSEDITKLSFEDRLLFIGLWSYVDDNGVGIDNARQITADLFALEDDPKAVREFVTEGLRRLQTAGLVQRYTARSKGFIYISTWDQHQRVANPNKPRYPRPGEDDHVPTSGNANPTDGLSEVYVDPTEGLGTGTGEQGNRGTEVHTSTGEPMDLMDRPRRRAKRKIARDYSPAFEAFWEIYPRTEGKGAAFDSWIRALDEGITAETMTDGARRYARTRRGQDPQYTKHGKTWINQECWLDTPALRAVGRRDLTTGRLTEIG
jgi:hypothetical protein